MAKNFCGGCGCKLNEGAKFCGGCGSPVDGEEAGDRSNIAEGASGTQPSPAVPAPPEPAAGPPKAAADSPGEAVPPQPTPSATGANGTEMVGAAAAKLKLLPIGALVCGVSGVALLFSLLMKYIGPKDLFQAGGAVIPSMSLFSASPVVGILAVGCIAACLAAAALYAREERNIPARLWLYPLITGLATAFGLVILALKPPVGLEGYVMGPRGGLMLGLIASVGACVGGLMMPGAPFGTSDGSSPKAVTFVDALRHVRTSENHLALSSLVLGCAGPLIVLIAALADSVAMLWIGMGASLGAVITGGIARSKAKTADDALTVSFARRSQWLGGATLIILILLFIAIIVVFAQVSNDFGGYDSSGTYGD